MFTLYDYDNPVFSGPLENLYRVIETNKKRPAPAYARSEDSAGKIAVDDRHGKHQFADLVTKEARQAYQEVLELKNDVEPILHAYQIMKHPVFTLETSMTIDQALHSLRQKQVSQMPLLNAQVQMQGLISKDTLLEYLHTHNFSADAHNTPLKTIAKNKVISAHPITDIRRIARVLIDYEINAIPIVNKHSELVGIVTRHDILECLTHDPPFHMWA